MCVYVCVCVRARARVCAHVYVVWFRVSITSVFYARSQYLVVFVLLLVSLLLQQFISFLANQISISPCSSPVISLHQKTGSPSVLFVTTHAVKTPCANIGDESSVRGKNKETQPWNFFCY